MEDSVAASPAEAASKYVDMFEQASDATSEAREKSERDRDYYDGKQLTAEEVSALKKRGQPPIALNVIRSRVDFMLGLEKKQRRDPKAWPRNNPEDVEAADAFTEGMRYVVQAADYSSARSKAWKNICVEGFGGVELSAVPTKDGDYRFNINRIPWDRIFYDPHSSEPDFSDAGYLGQVVWKDLDDAIAEYGAESEATLLASLQDTPLSRTYDDKPKSSSWADRRRRRVRIALMWHKEGGRWRYCEFTKGGVLVQYDSPYVDEDGEPWCPLILESCYVDRDNNRFSLVRDLIDPQDEVNKRRSKALHQSVSRGVVADKGAVADVNAARRELARPDFFVEKLPGMDFEVVDGQQLVAGQAALLQDAMNYIAQSGPNAALLGKGTEDQSGRAIEAQQAGGMIEQGDLLDSLRRMDHRVFKGVAQLIKQFWTAEKWVRVTDDEMSPRWVGLNVQAQGQWGEPVVQNSVADLDLDLEITDAPVTLSLDGENYQAFTQMLGSGLAPPFLKLAVEMHPGLSAKRKKQIIDQLDQMMQQPPPQPNPLQVAGAEADINLKKSQAFKNLADGHAKMTAPPPQLAAPAQPIPAL